MGKLSYWEKSSWLNNIDFLIVGSGIVGLNCAIHLRKNFPKAKILILEKGILPSGASTKNAGFACFGSVSELVEDLKSHSEEEVFSLVKKRVEGLSILRNNFGDKRIDYKGLGGYEVFLRENELDFNYYESEIPRVNNLLNPIFKQDAFSKKPNTYNFQNVVKNCFFTPFEGMLDTGKMMQALLKLAVSENILILNSVVVNGFDETDNGVKIDTNLGELKSSKLFFATNGFASQLLNEEVKPARAQVLITKPIKNLKFKGTFHLENGYYYFRNINNRILLGGGRNLDFKTEETTNFGTTTLVQDKLEHLLKEVIVPDRTIKIDYMWSGIMGVGEKKRVIVKEVSNNVFCGIRLGGMGVAIGSLIGKEMSELIN